MDKLNWEKNFSDVSEGFHNRVETTLNDISTGKYNKKRYFRPKAKVVLIAAAIIVFGGITANAAGLFKWNDKIAEKFNANEEQQNNLIVNSIAEQKKASVTNNGLTINLIQTFQDKNQIYIALEVTSPKDITLSDANLFEYNDVQLTGGWHNGSFGFIEHANGEKFTNKRIYECWFLKDSNTNIDGKTITLLFKNLQAQADDKKTDMHIVLEGEWKLSWTMDYKDSTKVFDLNSNYKLSDKDIYIYKAEISPLSMTIYYKSTDATKKLKKIATGDTDEAKSFDFKDWDILKPALFKGFKYKDGSSIQIKQGGPASKEFNYTLSGELTSKIVFDKVINVDNIESILFGRNDEVKLSDR